MLLSKYKHYVRISRLQKIVKLLLLTIPVTYLLSIGYAEEIKPKQNKNSDDDIEIKVESTRPRLTVGRGFGIAADIKNVSNSIIYLSERYVTMSMPPELQFDSYMSSWWPAYFPTEIHSGDGNDYYKETIAINPGESYKVFWYANPVTINTEMPPTSFISVVRNFYSNVVRISNDINSEMHFLFFTPGDYSITVSAKYWIFPTKPPDAGKYHTKIETKTLTFEAPQSVILFGALLGGLISYFLLPQARRKLIAMESDRKEESKFVYRLRKISKEVAGIFGSALLSIIVTILLARLSETQFLIRVTVSDFWGAVAIGFVANYAGAEVLNKIIKLPAVNSNNSSTQTSQKKEASDKSAS
jgi:hypothetical protein